MKDVMVVFGGDDYVVSFVIGNWKLSVVTVVK